MLKIFKIMVKQIDLVQLVQYNLNQNNCVFSLKIEVKNVKIIELLKNNQNYAIKIEIKMG